MFIHTKTQIFWLKILNIIALLHCFALLYFAFLLLNRMKTIVTTKAHRYIIIRVLVPFFFFRFQFSFSFPFLIWVCLCLCVCVWMLKLNTSSFETQKFTCTLTHIHRDIHIHTCKRSRWQRTFKAYPSNKWSRTNKKERANAQQKHPIESFSSYACQIRNDTELDEHDTSTQRETGGGEREKRASERKRGSWERQEELWVECVKRQKERERDWMCVCVQ